jgi:hypothetical protein
LGSSGNDRRFSHIAVYPDVFRVLAKEHGVGGRGRFRVGLRLVLFVSFGVWVIAIFVKFLLDKNYAFMVSCF